MIGVAWKLKSGRGPRLSVFHRQTIRRFLTLSLLIWSRGEYFVVPASLPSYRHSSFFGLCPDVGIVAHSVKATSDANRAAKRTAVDILPLPLACSSPAKPSGN